MFFFDLRLRLELMLDGCSTDLKTEKRFQETDCLGVVCHHLGYDNAPGGSVRGGGLKNGVKFLPAPFCALTPFCAGQTSSGCQKST